MSNTTTCILWPQPHKIWTKSDQNVTKYNRVIFARLVLPLRQTLFCPRRQIFVVWPSLNVFKNTTCSILPIYLGPQVCNLIQVWLYSWVYHAKNRRLMLKSYTPGIDSLIGQKIYNIFLWELSMSYMAA